MTLNPSSPEMFFSRVFNSPHFFSEQKCSCDFFYFWSEYGGEENCAFMIVSFVMNMKIWKLLHSKSDYIQFKTQFMVLCFCIMN